jgi:membrane-associated phospholipid phosphatase
MPIMVSVTDLPPGPERVRARRAGFVLAAISACAVLTVQVWHSRAAVGWERPVISLLSQMRPPFARPIVLLWEPLPFAVLTLWLGWVALRSHKVQLAISGTVGCAVASVFTERLLKPLIDRHVAHAGSALFPSGHVTAAAAWSMFAFLLIDPRVRGRFALLLVPGLVAWTVVSEGLHLPADAVAGLLVGGLVVYGVVFAADHVRSHATALIQRSRASTIRTRSTPSFEPSRPI